MKNNFKELIETAIKNIETLKAASIEPQDSHLADTWENWKKVAEEALNEGEKERSDFFTKLSQLMTDGVDLTIIVNKKDQQMTLSILPAKADADEDDEPTLTPLTVAGTIEELDKDFFEVIGTNLKEASAGLIVNEAKEEPKAEVKKAETKKKGGNTAVQQEAAKSKAKKDQRAKAAEDKKEELVEEIAEEIKEEVKEEVKEEIKQEIKEAVQSTLFDPEA